ncbi:helix-turn-helix transcriptional regulator [Hydrogenophaga laconesensis]|uniref:AraC-like DNA-binding protein n=1 Tax=Hydrogenophaga laconesensis TaxID=1805971 RepID=A0ABU1VEI1_9BURK|nr:AraC family transcriptional regulator [Hydrogenophaga laconesensis]MDR7095882.1 AraC-like DNA-binding protein [Hydrogenophaga laconesensis]
MNDFASEAMLRLMRAGLQRQGLVPDGPPPVPHAHVALADKRTWLERLWRDHGPGVIVRLGEALQDLEDEPLGIALSLARDPLDLLQRWQRLERFVHARHRTRVTHSARGLLRIQHVSRDPRQPPAPAEDVLVFGFLAALFERAGAPALRARPVGHAAWCRVRGNWQTPAWPDDLSHWEFRWTAQPDRSRHADRRIEADHWIAQLQQRLVTDPGRGWTVELLASEMAASPRTLQRRLARQGQSFTRLLSGARLSSAARLLASSSMATAEVGYVCGFADQAHFTRQFKQHTAMTPGLYRHEFAMQDGA